MSLRFVHFRDPVTSTIFRMRWRPRALPPTETAEASADGRKVGKVEVDELADALDLDVVELDDLAAFHTRTR